MNILSILTVIFTLFVSIGIYKFIIIILQSKTQKKNINEMLTPILEITKKDKTWIPKVKQIYAMDCSKCNWENDQVCKICAWESRIKRRN